MKGSRLIAIILLVVIVLFFAISALLPSKYSVTKEITVQASLERIYGLVANVKEWSSWYPIYRTEPLAEYLYVGDVQEVGSLMSWRGLDIGKGQVTLTATNPPFSVQMQRSTVAPKVSVNTYTWELNEDAAGTVRVLWTKEGDLSFPFEKWRGLVMNSVAGPYLEQGLDQLKTVAELRPLEPPSAPLDPFPDAPSAAGDEAP